MDLNELLKGIEKEPVKKKSVTVIKLSPLDRLADDEISSKCPECGKMMDEGECDDDDEKESSPDIMKILSDLGIDLSKK